ncbi:SLATT domain-containing protein [Blastococcus sp. PRF04-17]|uniref:SLATT domain-containing protein n=1 Tax=Blastococcus sp. PRF04-17 TaxID=2933797 RepID=UPI001FF6DB4B|nr:SLATT domain-containing protein [Blastococcus sp. PRF04-17]UOY01636.1 SLATT domain-containing protein [Blastococcus sp. PRF04-17]
MADLVTEAAWRDAAAEELRQLIDDMLHTEKAHLTTAARLQKVHRPLGGLAALLAAAGGATVLADLSALLAGFLALGAALASGVLTFLKPDQLAEQHLGAGRQLGALRVRARQTLHLDVARLSTDELRTAIAGIAEDKAKIDSAAPGTNDKDYAVGRQKILNGTYDRDR